jgi:putative DNA primase/helicase
VRPVDLVLERADNARRVSGGWLVSCPVTRHGQGRGDVNPSVSVTEGDDGRALVRCKTGCDTESVVSSWGLTMADLFKRRNGHGRGGSYASPETRSTGQPATLENYAAYVGLPVEFLKGLGLKEYHHLGDPAVSMPYLDGNGEVLLTRSRVSLTGKPKVKTRKGDKHRHYGLWKLQAAREVGYLWLVEGESDTQTLWYHGEPAAGLPGANGWKAGWAEELANIERIFFMVEDEPGTSPSCTNSIPTASRRGYGRLKRRPRLGST